jgi:hypothetical protein
MTIIRHAATASKKITTLRLLFSFKRKRKIVNASPNNSAFANKNFLNNTFLGRKKVVHQLYRLAEEVVRLVLEEVAAQTLQRPTLVLPLIAHRPTLLQTPQHRLLTKSMLVIVLIAKLARLRQRNKAIHSTLTTRCGINNSNKRSRLQHSHGLVSADSTVGGGVVSLLHQVAFLPQLDSQADVHSLKLGLFRRLRRNAL